MSQTSNSTVNAKAAIAGLMLLYWSGHAVALDPRLAEIQEDIEADYQQVEHIGAGDFTAMNSESIVLFDVREQDEFSVSHIRGAIQLEPSIDSDEFDKRYGKLLDGKTVVFYCSVGRRSSIVAEKLDILVESRGSKASYNLIGGIFNWRNENRPLVQDEATETQSVHPYNRYWGRLIIDKTAHAYSPVN